VAWTYYESNWREADSEANMRDRQTSLDGTKEGGVRNSGATNRDRQKRQIMGSTGLHKVQLRGGERWGEFSLEMIDSQIIHDLQEIPARGGRDRQREAEAERERETERARDRETERARGR
jgi:hypothetical protein